ncbi:ABC transporter substrate-binding protein [Roseomonas sp. CCTCC AB2023176]|uniref:ABC transporter substrate-binding protein n=1 Tax=Roseomonas sp. CCTCC AB2023176 TaxID=3342640 RepID=UPI0035D7911D
MTEITRRFALMAGAGLLAAPPIVERANAQSQFDWRRFRGERIEVTLTRSPRSDVMERYHREFTELTGIQVGSESIPEQQHRQKVAIEFSSGRPSFDVVTIALHVQKRLAARGNWLSDLRPMLADPNLTAPDYDWNGLSEGGRRYVTQADGKIDSLPLNIDFWIMYYNRRLFRERGLQDPRNMDELVGHAKALTNASRQQFGFVGRGLRNANVPVWTSWLLGQDMETIDRQGRLTTDGPEAVWAGEMYKTLLREAAPPGVVGFNWNECQTSFMQGRVGMWLDGVGFAMPLLDRQRSRVVEDVGFAVVPPGPKAHHSAIFGDGIGVSRTSTKQGPAYLYAQFMTGKAMLGRMLSAGAGTPPRDALYQDASIMQGSPFGREWFETVLKSQQIGRPGLPEIVPVTEFRDTIGIGLTNTVGGADVASELKKATDAFRPVLEQSERAS